MDTLLLDRTAWDLCLDAAGNIAVAGEPYRIAQDVASAVRLFRAELWYDTTKGVPYFERILGRRPPMRFFSAQVEKAALTVPSVVKARCTVASLVNGQLAGQIEVIDTTGQQHNVQF